MRDFLQRAFCLAVACSLGAGAAAAQSASPAAQTVPIPGAKALAERIASVRQHYMSSRLSAAKQELSDTLDLIHVARVSGEPKALPQAHGQLPRAGTDVPMPGLVKRTEPDYPVEALTKNITGYVVLDVVLDKSGKVRDPTVAKSIPEFDQAAINAAKTWRFAVSRINGSPVEVSTTLVFAFVIRRQATPPDELDLARFYIERGEYALAETSLNRALTVVAREADCVAAIFAAAGAQRGTGAAGGFSPPRKVRDVKPVYPALAQKARVMGVVVIEAIIGVDGRVQCARVVKSLPLLDEAALDAVSQWEFVPTLVAGKPTPTRMTMTVNFALQ